VTTLAVTLALGRLLVPPVFTRAKTSVSTGATGPPGPGLWKRAQTPIKEPAMATIHLHQTTTDGYFKVHNQGPAQAGNYQGQAQS
jgi:hypothetical protein